MREIGMARGRGDRADKAATPTVAKSTPSSRVTPTRVKPTKIKAAPRAAAPKRPKPELEQFDLKAALPFFLARIGIFLVIAVVLWLAVGLNPLVAVLLGLIGGALAGYPLARMQKRAARIKSDSTVKPARPSKP